MKLWNCIAFCDGYDPQRLMVGESEGEVYAKWELELEDQLVYGLFVDAVIEVDGYIISLTKKE